MPYAFFAYLSRLKLIRRWSLMRNTQPENDAEHSLQVAMIAHAIAVIGRDRYHRDTDPEHVLTLAVYHDATEVMTGDLPTPVKYHNEELRNAYHRLEDVSADRLLDLLPEDMRPAFFPCLRQENGYDRDVVKAADKISAYIKCLERSAPETGSLTMRRRMSAKAWMQWNFPKCAIFCGNSCPPLK